MKINLGCGHRHLPGFVNVDMPDNWAKKLPDVSADISQRLPFDDGVADEVHAYHVLEHMWRWQVPEILQDWARVLKPGGLMVLEMPCLDKILHYMHASMRADVEMDPRLSIWGMYGDPRYRSEAMTHKWCYAQQEAIRVMQDAGLTDVCVRVPQTHVAIRDMRVEGTK